MIKYEKYEGRALTNEGTLQATVGEGTISFLTKNFNNPDKRVVILIKQADGTSATLTCSQALSEELRAGKISIEELAGLEILENEDGVSYLSLPGEATKDVSLANVKVKPYKAASRLVLPGALKEVF